MKRSDAPKAVRRHHTTVGGPSASRANNGTRTEIWGRLLMVRSSLVVVVVALCASVLVPVVVSAHDPEEVPYTETREEPVFNYEDREVRVAPFSETTTVDVSNYEDRQVRVAPYTTTVREDVFNYETQRVRVAPFSETTTVDVFNYEDRQVRVAPYTTTVREDVFNYETQRVRVAPYTTAGRIALFNYEDRRVRVAPFSEVRTIPVYNYETVASDCRPPRGCVYTRVRVAPYTTTVRVDVFNYETQRVRVAPFFRVGQIPVFNYETQRVRVAPFSETTTVDVFNYRTVRVRVAPYTTTVRVDVFNYETQRVRVAPFSETTTVDVFNYRTVRVRVAPYTTTVRVDVFNYETQRVRVAPYTRTVTYTHPTETDSRHDASEHVCPAGQHMAPFPTLRVYRSGAVDVFTTALSVSVPVFGVLPWSGIARLLSRVVDIDTAAVEWVEVDSHTGCHSPRFPILEQLQAFVDIATVDWSSVGRVGSSTVTAAQSALDDVNLDVEGVGDFIIDTNESYLDLHSNVTAWGSEITHKALYIYLCVPEAQLARGLADTLGLPAATLAAGIKALRVSRQTHLALAAGGVAGVTYGVTVVVAEYVVCNYTENPWADRATTTTTTTTLPPTTTTTLPPTTTTTAVSPPSLPVVTRLPVYDTVNYRLRFFYIQAVPSSCTPWVYWQVQPSLTLLVALCPR